MSAKFSDRGPKRAALLMGLAAAGSSGRPIS